MQSLGRATLPVVVLTLLSVSTPLLAQRALCTQLPASDRERARAAGLCRDPAPIIDVTPRPPDGALPPTVTSTATSLAVPNVVGQSFDDARSRLTRFTLQRSYRAAAEAGGTVLAQAPMAPATLPAGSPVSLVLSDGSLVKVPRVIGVNINEARQRLQQDVELKAQPVVVTSDLRVGTVIEQQPPEGTLVKRGSVVSLQVSAGPAGPEMIEVPNVVGLSFDRAKAGLARFAVERADRPNIERKTSAPEGQVVEQTPRAATRAAMGSVVVLTVASAPRAAIEVFEMPNVVGRSYANAARSLAEFKITRTEIESTAPRDQIVAQIPAAATALAPGAAVALQVSIGPTAPVTNAPAVAANAAANAPIAVDAPKSVSGRGVLAGVLGISAAVILGLIAGGLLMRQWLSRQRAVAAADHAITSLSPAPMAVTSVDILLEAGGDAERARDHPLPLEPVPTPPPQEERSEKENGQDKGPRS